jgi:hypothetical protein
LAAYPKEAGMSMEENKALSRRFVEEVYNNGNLDAVDILVRTSSCVTGSVAP